LWLVLLSSFSLYLLLPLQVLYDSFPSFISFSSSLAILCHHHS
jgi:hypothetical protein